MQDDVDAEVSEVPAAVVCAFCGMAECPGCDATVTRSGVLKLVPWERSGVSARERFLATSRTCVQDASTFFAVIPDGPIPAALTFAFAAELIASTGAFLAIAGLAFAFVPGSFQTTLFEPHGRTTTWRFAAIGIPSVAAVLVAAHVAHGLALEWGTGKSSRETFRRALRFGLYACGWDFVLGPVGALWVLVAGGPRDLWTMLGAAKGLPTRSALAYLKGVHGLEGAATSRALHASYAAAVVATLIAATLVTAMGLFWFLAV